MPTPGRKLPNLKLSASFPPRSTHNTDDPLMPLDLAHLDHMTNSDAFPPDTSYYPSTESLSAPSVGFVPPFMPSIPFHQDNARKRQRRQAAGSMVVNILQRVGGTNVASPPNSTATQQQQQQQQQSQQTSQNQLKQKQTGTRKKQSTAQPRPDHYVAPRGIGPVFGPNENDVLSGRGGRINSHEGNVRFRELVALHKTEYLDKSTKKLEKAHIAARLVYHIRMLDPPGRFLKEENDGTWYDIGDAKAIKKVGQALREDAKEIRDGDDENDELKKEKKTNKKDRGESSSDEDAKPSKKIESSKKSGPAPISPDGKAEKVNIESSTVLPLPQSDKVFAAGTSVLPPTQISSSGSSSPRKPVTVVSGRGGKMSSPRFPAHQSVEIAPPPAYQPVIPSPAQSYHFYNASNSYRGTVPRTSGAAAAVMQQEIIDPTLPEFEVPGLPASCPQEAFGLPFHYADYQMGEMSQISGLSNSQISGTSGISGLTDPISSISGSGKGDSYLIRALHLDKVKHNWTSAPQSHNSWIAANADAGHFQMQQGSAGVGNPWNDSGPSVRLLAQHPQLFRSSLTMEDINWAGSGYNSNSVVVSRGRDGSGNGSAFTGIGSFGSDGSPRMDSLLFSSSLLGSHHGTSNNSALGGSSRHSVRSGLNRARSQGVDCMSISSTTGMDSVLSMVNSVEDISTVFSGLELGDASMLD